MSQHNIKENITVTYKNDKITIKGATFTLEGVLTSSELMNVYWGSKGRGTAKITIDLPDAKPASVDPKK